MSWIRRQIVALLRNRLAAFRALIQDYPAFLRALGLGALIYITAAETLLAILGK